MNKLAMRFTALLMAALMLLPTLGAGATSPEQEVTPQVEGMGTEASPILLGSAEDLKRFAEQYNAGGFAGMGTGGVLYAALSADIELDGVVTVEPIGTEARPFTGVFDGAGHMVGGLSGEGGGLFGVVSGGKIHDLALVDVALEGSDVGAIANVVKNGRVERVYASGTVAGSGAVGGLVGRMESAVLQNARSDAEVAHGGASGSAGGLVGHVSGGTLSAGYATGRLDVAKSGVSAGGVVGRVEAAASATDIVALQAVVASKGAANRAVGAVSGTGTNAARLWAWADMRLGGSPGTGADGADVTTGTLSGAQSAPDFWGGTVGLDLGSGGGAGVWELSPGGLPVLAGLAGQNTALPDYFDPDSGYPYETLTIESAGAFLDFVNAVNGGNAHEGVLVKLETDVNVSGTSGLPTALPIGKNGTLFAGVFDGGGHTLSVFAVNSTSSSGMFSALKNATVRNLTLQVRKVTGGGSVGSLVGAIEDGGSVRIENCTAMPDPSVFGNDDALVLGKYNVGGLVGKAGDGAVITDCESSVRPGRSVANSDINAGGIVGTALPGSLIRRSMFTGSINTEGDAGILNVGGIVGSLSGGAVEECFVIAPQGDSIKVAGGASAGGIAGRVTDGEVRNCYNNDLPIQSDAAQANAATLGGLAGTVSGGLVEDSYAAAAVSGNGSGGLVGLLEGSAAGTGTVRYCVSLMQAMSAQMPRVAGAVKADGHGYALAGNYAWRAETMSDFVTSDPNGQDGETVPLADFVAGIGFLAVRVGGGFANTAVWSVKAERLPILVAAGHGQQGSLPRFLENYLSGQGAMAGKGTEAEPYLVATAAHLFEMAEKVNDGVAGPGGGTAYYKAHYRMTADVDMDTGTLNVEGKPWVSAGDGAISLFTFQGVFDGDGHTISNLRVPYAADDEAGGGLFGILEGATVKNLTLAHTMLEKMTLPGAIAGSATNSRFQNCTVTDLEMKLYTSGVAEGAGFLVATAKNSDFENCHADGIFSQRAKHAGGIVGSVTGGSLAGCSFSGSIEAAGSVGGLAGRAVGTTITGGTVQAEVRAMRFSGETDTTQYAGGIVGDGQNAKISLCAFRGNASADQYAGGIAGRLLYGSVSQSHSCGNVSADKYAGGIAGALNGAAAKHCYTTGVVMVDDTHAGGIAGIVQAGSYSGKKYGGSVQSSYSAAQVQAYKGYVGGIAGQLGANSSGQSGKNTLKNNVAVNVSVTSVTGASTIGRITGKVGSGTTVSGNHAPTSLAGIAATKKGTAHGTAVTLASLARPTFWQGLGFTEAAGWVQYASSLPILGGITRPDGWTGSLPFHLTGYATAFEVEAWRDGRAVEQVVENGIALPKTGKVDMAIVDRDVEFRMTAAAGQQWTEYKTEWTLASSPVYDVNIDDSRFGAPTGQGEAVVCALTIPKGYKGTIIVTGKDVNSGATASFTLIVVERAAMVSASPTDLALDKGGTGKLEATVLPTGADEKGVTWKSSSKTVATVDQSGNVKALAYGTAMMTATTVDGGYTATVAVRVAPGLGESDLGLSKTAQTLAVGKSATLKPTYKNSKVAIHTLVWDIVVPDGNTDPAFDPADVATVDQNGKVTAVGPGEVWVTVTATPAVGAPQTARCVLSVPSATVNVVETQYFTGHGAEYEADRLLNKKTVRLVPEGYADGEHNWDTLSLSAVLSSSNSAEAAKWSVSGKADAVVKVMQNDAGSVTLKAVKAGKVTLSATTALGKKAAKVTLDVVSPMTGSTLSIRDTADGAYKSYIAVGAASTLKADITTPAGAPAPGNRKLTWTSTDTDVVTVNATSGKLKAVAPGKATIRVESQDDPRVFTTCTVYVVAPVKTAKTSQSAFSMRSGEPYETATPTSLYHRTLTLNLNGGSAVTHNDPANPQDAYTTYHWSIPDGAPLVFAGTESQTSTESAPILRVKTGGSLEKNTAVSLKVTVQSGSFKAVTATLKVTVLSAANSKNYVPVEVAKFKISNTGAGKSVSLLTSKTFKPSLSFGKPAPSDKNVAWNVAMTGGGDWRDHISLDTTTGTVKALAPTHGKTITVMATALDNPLATDSYTLTVTQRATSVKVASDSGEAALDVTRGAYGGGTLTLRATVAPQSVSDASVKWTSKQENKTVAIDRSAADGSIVVTGLKAGTATITATAQDGSKKAGTFKVTVVQQVDGFEITIPSKYKAGEGEAALARGQATTLGLKFNDGLKNNQPKNKAVTWTASPTDVATVSTKGKVTATGKGIATITATSKDSGEAQSITVAVTAKATKVTMCQKKFSLYAGRTVIISAATTPELAALSGEEGQLTWTLANYNVLDFDGGQGEVVGATTKKTWKTQPDAQGDYSEDGVTLKAAAAGIDGKLPGGKTSVTCRVTATAKSGKSAYVDIVVTSVRKSAAQVQGVKLNKNSLWLQKGKSETLKATLSGEVLSAGAKATAPGNKNLIWSVTDPEGNPTDVATVSTSGKVTAKGTGVVRVTVRAVDAANTGGWDNAATCTIVCVAKN